MEWKSGDTVQLKSGGPVMTVKFVETGEVACQWFNDKHVLCSGRFTSEMLHAFKIDDYS